MRLFIAMFIAYLVGSIPTGYLFAKYKNIDLRLHGSGNVGATNVFRAVGKLAALITLIIDVLKGLIVVSVLADMLYSFRIDMGFTHYRAVLALCVVAGHNWPVFLKFKGGKGVATSAGVLLVICPKALLIGLCIWVFVFICTKIVSLASIMAAVAMPISTYFYTYSFTTRYLTIALAILLIMRHRTNIKRLISKEEKRIVVKI